MEEVESEKEIGIPVAMEDSGRTLWRGFDQTGRLPLPFGISGREGGEK